MPLTNTRGWAWLIASLLLFSGCVTKHEDNLAPDIRYKSRPRDLTTLPCPFLPLSPAELAQDWGKELKVARAFARNFDLYRAITFYKRAIVLMPGDETQRLWEAEFGVILSYYLGGKHEDVICEFEKSALKSAPPSFVAFEDLLILLQDAYRRIGEEGPANQVMELIEKGDPELAEDLHLSLLVSQGKLAQAQEVARAELQVPLDELQATYCCCELSDSKAQLLQALLPGAGYGYIGQKKSALTSFLINAAFCYATYRFAQDSNWGAAAITGSLEAGWYFGGINGVGIAAREANCHRYHSLGYRFLRDEKLFPQLMLMYAF